MPLQSTEADVERLFGKATRRYANIGKYETKDGILTIEYSIGECGSRLANYSIPKDTVVYIDFLLKKPVNFKVIKEDLSDFEMEESSDTQNETYKNLTTGVEYGVFVRSKEDMNYEKNPRFLIDISVYPPKKYSYLECSNKAKQKEPE